jgi:hypothetical protein
MFLNGRGGEVKGCLRGCRTFQPRMLGKQSSTFRAYASSHWHYHSSCFLLSRGDWESDWALQIIADRECSLSLDVWTNASDGLHLQIASNANSNSHFAGLIFSINLRSFSCCLLRWVPKQERSHVLEDGHDGKASCFYLRINVSHPEGDR